MRSDAIAPDHRFLADPARARRHAGVRPCRCRRPLLVHARLPASARRPRPSRGDDRRRPVGRARRRPRASGSGRLAFVAHDGRRRLLGRAGVALPLVEPAIALSVVVLGVLVAATVRVPVARRRGDRRACSRSSMAMPTAPKLRETGWLGYAAGFVVATALLHRVGIGIGAAAGAQCGPRSACARIGARDGRCSASSCS